MNLKAFLLKLIARKPCKEDLQPNKIQKVLIVRPAKIGDTICLYPMIREMKRAYPDWTIDIYAGKDNNFMFRHVRQVNNVYTKFRNRQFIKTFQQLLMMRRNHYDLVVDTLDIRFGKVMLLVLIHPKWIIGCSGYASRYGIKNSDLAIYCRLTPWKLVHTTDLMLSYLLSLDIEYTDNRMEMPLSKDSQIFAETFTASHKKNLLIGINIDASNPDRSVTDDEFLEIYSELLKIRHNAVILILCSPDRQKHFRQLAEYRNLANLIVEKGSRNFFDAAAIVKYLDILISVNTSFIHVASAFNTPTVGIYHNEPIQLECWGPRSKLNEVITPEERGDSIRGFNPSDVANAAFRLLKKHHSS